MTEVMGPFLCQKFFRIKDSGVLQFTNNNSYIQSNSNNHLKVFAKECLFLRSEDNLTMTSTKTIKVESNEELMLESSKIIANSSEMTFNVSTFEINTNEIKVLSSDKGEIIKISDGNAILTFKSLTNNSEETTFTKTTVFSESSKTKFLGDVQFIGTAKFDSLKTIKVSNEKITTDPELMTLEQNSETEDIVPITIKQNNPDSSFFQFKGLSKTDSSSGNIVVLNSSFQEYELKAFISVKIDDSNTNGLAAGEYFIPIYQI